MAEDQGVTADPGDIDPLAALLDEELGASRTKTITVELRSGARVPWTVQQVSDDVYKRLQKRCRRKLGKSKETVWDGDLFASLLIYHATVSPDLNDPRLLTKYGVPVAEEVVDKILLPGQKDFVGNEAMTLMGYLDELIEDAKNS